MKFVKRYKRQKGNPIEFEKKTSLNLVNGYKNQIEGEIIKFREGNFRQPIDRWERSK